MRRNLCLAFLLSSILIFSIQLYPNQKKAKTFVKTQIVLTDGGTPILRRSIQGILTTVVQEINKKAAGAGNLEKIRQYCTDAGFVSIRELVTADRIYSIEPEVKTNLIDILPSGYFEVRSIKVNVGRLSRQLPVFEYLVFTLDSNGTIADLQYAIEKHQYEKILAFGKELPDSPRRRQIIRFLEKYQTAYNTKNLPYLEKIFSDYALIIVGLVIQEQSQDGDFLEEHSLLGPDEVRLIKRSKRQYLDSLRIKVFEKNCSVNIKLSNIEVIQHDSIPYIYGATTKQEWKSRCYSDTGYLFIMFDFQNQDQPIIHVRSWQPRPFNDGSVVNLYDFQFEPKAH